VGRIVFSDVDGTLLNSQGEIAPRTLQAIRLLAEQDIPFVISSARGPTGIAPLLKTYGLKCPVIAFSGALILDEEGKVLFHRGMKKQQAGEILDFIRKKELDLAWGIYAFSQWVVKTRQDQRVDAEERNVRALATEGALEDIKGDTVHKILCMCNPEKLDEIEACLKTRFPQFSIAKSSSTLLEIMQSGITKAMAVETLCVLRQIPLENSIAFGDNYNDAEMLETAGKGFLMGNAPEKLKSRIPLHTEDCDHDGIYWALKRLEWI